MIYLASPYSHPDPAIQQHRFEEVCKIAGRLIQKGLVIFCPISMSHCINLLCEDLGGDWETWKHLDLAIIDRCDELYVCTMEGWEDSIGVCAEIRHAIKRGIPVKFLNTD